MRTITTTGYKYEELSVKSQQKAREWFRSIDTFFDVFHHDPDTWGL